jgi:hypothetical protein
MKRTIATLLGAAALLAAGGCMTHPERIGEQRCDWPEPVVATAAHAVPAYRFAGIDTTWTLARLFARLGPAARAVGDPALTYEWDAADGRVFVASASSRCGLVYKAEFVAAGPPKS